MPKLSERCTRAARTKQKQHREGGDFISTGSGGGLLPSMGECFTQVLKFSRLGDISALPAYCEVGPGLFNTIGDAEVITVIM